MIQGTDDNFIHTDDIFIASEDNNSHMETLQSISTQIQKHRLRVSSNMCEAMHLQIDLLGCAMDQSGIRPTSSKPDMPTKLAGPNNKILRRYLEMISFYGQHILKFAAIVEPLQKLLNGTPPNKQQFHKNVLLTRTEKHDDFQSFRRRNCTSNSASSLTQFEAHTQTDNPGRVIGGSLHEVTQTTPSYPIANNSGC